LAVVAAAVIRENQQIRVVAARWQMMPVRLLAGIDSQRTALRAD